MNKLLIVWRFLIAVFFSAILVGCGGGDSKTAPSITTQPTGVSVRSGESATFSVVAAGTAPLAYQWKRDGVAIAGATSANYTITASAADSGAKFTVTVSNEKTSVTSTEAILKVPAKIAGILLLDEASIQINQATYTLQGELVMELDGDLPSVSWKIIGPTPAEGTIQPVAKQFNIELPIAVGDNRVEIVAQDGSTQLLTFEKSITRNPVAAFKGTVEFSRNLAFVNESVSVSARVAVDSTAVVAGGVKLVEVLANGTESEVATLTDSGNLAVGDEVQGDGVYSALFNVLGSTETTRNYRVVATLSGAAGGSVRSVVRTIQITTHLPDATLTAILDSQKASTSRLVTAQAGGLTALKAAVQTELAALKLNSDVEVASANEAGTAISVIYKSGIAGVIGAPDPSVKGGAVGLESAARLSRTGFGVSDLSWPQTESLSSPYAAYRGDCPQPTGTANGESAGVQQPTTSSGRAQIQAVTASTTKVGSNRVYALAANYSQWGDNDDVPQLAALLKKTGCLDVNYKKTTTAGGGSVEDFKNLDKYGLVLISSHGDTHFSFLGSDYFTSWTALYKLFGWTPASSQVVIYSNMKVTTANKVTYESDLKAGRLVIWGDTYGIMPTFIRKYSGTMPNSVIYMSICRGSWNNTLADAFISNGAKAFLGYSDYVGVPFTVSSGTTLFTEFLKSGQTLADAFSKVTPKVETVNDHAEFRLAGQSDIQVSQGLNDGGFESGTLGSWVASGDGRVITQLGTAQPTGKYMAIISTGLGFTTQAGSVSQTICLGTETVLSYRWNFQSEEFLEYVGSQYQDAFLVTIQDVDDSSNQTTVQSDAVDSLASGVSKVSNVFDKGDVYATGWRTKTFTIPKALQGKRVRLTFSVSDVGDSIYDSAVLLDDVTLN